MSRMIRRTLLLIAAVGVMFAVAMNYPALAEPAKKPAPAKKAVPAKKVGVRGGLAVAESWLKTHRSRDGSPPSRTSSARRSGSSLPSRIGTSVAKRTTSLPSRPSCTFSRRAGLGYVDVYTCVPAPSAPKRAKAAARPAAVRAVDPQVVAREAVARLRLTAPKPAVGPPPSINRWKMAAVGYPLWLWVEGNTNPAPVTDTDGPLSVTLHARVTSISFTMGDGHTVTCATTGTKWTRSVQAGTPSPTCGYRYTKPSLPKGNYTVTATTRWAVDWNINGSTGTIPYPQTSSISLPVGELQVLVR